nr:hypothetical protein [Tanacetum cinerariifolium]
MGFEKPSTKLTFYKAFFSSQWKFLLHTILQCMSAKRTSWNEFSSSMAFAVICLSTCRKFNFSKYIFDNLVRNVDSSTKFYMYPRFLQLMIRAQVGDFSSHTIKYSSPALTQKVFANIRRVGKGYSGVETPLFEGMIVEQQVDEGAAAVNVKDVSTTGVVAEGDVSVADDVVPTAIKEPSIPSPTPPTPPLQPSQDQPSTSQDKIAQALEITKLKQRDKKLERRNKASKLKRLKKGMMIAHMDADVDVTLKDVALNAKIDDAEVQGSATLTDATPQLTTAAAPTFATAPSAARRRKGVGMTYDDIRPIFEKNFNYNVAFLLKKKEQMDKEDNRALKRNFDREDLEVLQRLVKERFTSTKPKNFFDDFPLTTLRAMFEKLDMQAQIWKNQRSVYGQAKVKSWKLLESCGVQIITFTITQLILLVERRYPLTRFTLDQMLNNVRLEVEEESEVSLELLSFGVDAAEDFKENMLSD